MRQIKHPNDSNYCSLLLRLDTAENPSKVDGLLANNTIFCSEILGDRHSAILILVHLASNLVHLGRLDTLHSRVDVNKLQLCELVVLLVGENAERDVERKSAVLWFVDGEDGDADVRLFRRGSGYSRRESGESSEKS